MYPPNEQARVFFALWPKQQERAALAAWQTDLHRLCGGRVMRADTLHATLVFLGEVAGHRLEALQLAAQEVAVEPFELCFDTARYWGHNHIVFAAPGFVPPRLLELVDALEQRLRKHHFHFDERPYKPHVTLMRNAQWSDNKLPHMEPVLWKVNDFVLLQSMYIEQGGGYKVLARFGASELE